MSGENITNNPGSTLYRNKTFHPVVLTKGTARSSQGYPSTTSTHRRHKPACSTCIPLFKRCSATRTAHTLIGDLGQYSSLALGSKLSMFEHISYTHNFMDYKFLAAPNLFYYSLLPTIVSKQSTLTSDLWPLTSSPIIYKHEEDVSNPFANRTHKDLLLYGA